VICITRARSAASGAQRPTAAFGANRCLASFGSQWIGCAYSHDSGDTYFGTIALKGPNVLQAEACALGRCYCLGNNWTRIVTRPEKLITSRQFAPEPRS